MKARESKCTLDNTLATKVSANIYEWVKGKAANRKVTASFVVREILEQVYEERAGNRKRIASLIEKEPQPRTRNASLRKANNKSVLSDISAGR